MEKHTGLVWVLEIVECPVILFWHFPGLESPGKLQLYIFTNLHYNKEGYTSRADSI